MRQQQEGGSLPGGECAKILWRNQPTTLITKAQCLDTAVYVGQQNQPAHWTGASGVLWAVASAAPTHACHL